MKKIIWVAVFLVAGRCMAGDSVPVPWSEFKSLYKESLEKQIMQQHEAEKAPPAPFVHSLDEAVYVVTLDSNGASGEVLLSGRAISGKPEPVRIFEPDFVISGIKQISGGHLISGAGTRGASFMPHGTNEFQLQLSFLAAPQADKQSRYVSFGIPPALRNSLEIHAGDGIRLAAQPGVADAKGIRHFSSQNSCMIRFLTDDEVTAASVVDCDIFSVIQVEDQRLLLTSHFAAVRALPPSVTLRMPKNAVFLASSLRPSCIRPSGDGLLTIQVPPDETAPFSIQFALNDESRQLVFPLDVPRIENNRGREGAFVIEQPDDAQVTLTGDGLAKVPADRLPPGFADIARKHHSYAQIPPSGSAQLAVARFRSLATAPVILERMSFFVAFEENGNVLSTLVTDIPPEFGSRLEIKAIPGMEIWSLAVNGLPRKVYAGTTDTWIIPLVPGETSNVRLALLRKGQALGLHGRLETVIPETGLPARALKVGVALPARVQLLSLEGPLAPDTTAPGSAPPDFIGKPHYFSRSFYKGESMNLEVSYREPVNAAQAEGTARVGQGS